MRFSRFIRKEKGDRENPGDESEPGGQKLIGGDVTAIGERIADGEGDGSRRGRDAEQEGEAGAVGPLEAQEAGGGHGDPRTARAGDQRQCLRHADHQGARQRHIGDGLGLRAIGVGDEHQEPEQDRVPGYDGDVAIEIGDAELLEGNAEHHGRNGGDDDVEGEATIVGDLAAQQHEPAGDKAPHIAPEIDENRKQGAEMHHHVGENALIFPAGQCRNENQMPRRRNGEEFRDPLHHGEHDDLF